MYGQKYTVDSRKSSDTSTKLTSYRKFVSSGKARSIRKRLLDILGTSGKPLTTNELADRLGTTSSNITQPLLMLRDSGLVQYWGKKRNPKTGLPNKAYVATANYVRVEERTQ